VAVHHDRFRYSDAAKAAGKGHNPLHGIRECESVDGKVIERTQVITMCEIDRVRLIIWAGHTG